MAVRPVMPYVVASEDEDEPPDCTLDQLRMDECLVDLHRRLPRPPPKGHPSPYTSSAGASAVSHATPVTFPLTLSPRSSARQWTTPPESETEDSEEAAFRRELEEQERAEEEAFLAKLDEEEGEEAVDTEAPPSDSSTDADEEEEAFLRVLEVDRSPITAAPPPQPPSLPPQRLSPRGEVVYEKHRPVRDIAARFNQGFVST